MRVTKLIKEYVMEEVHAKYQKQIDKAIAEAISTQKEREFNEEVEAMRELWEQNFTDLMRKYDIVDCFEGREHVRTSSCSCNLHHKDIDKNEKEVRKLKRQEVEAIQKILLNLELGGATLNELNEMIANA